MECETKPGSGSKTGDIERGAADVKAEIMIPKHRFDCINFSLKETKEKLYTVQNENDGLKREIAALKENLLKSAAETGLAAAGAKNLKAACALIDFERIRSDAGDGIITGLREQINALKKENGYLFESNKDAYVIFPVDEKSTLKNAIIRYTKKLETEK